jgi:integrase
MGSKRSNGEGGVPRQRKDGRWAAEITVADPQTGLPRRKTIYGATKALCSANIQAAVIERESGTLVVGRSMKFIDWLHWWLENDVSGRKPLTYRGYCSKVRLYVEGTALGDLPLTKITPAHLQKLYVSMRKRGLSDSTIKQLSAILSRALKVAVQHGHLGSNPADRMDSPKAGTFKPELLSGDNAKVLLAAAAELDPEDEALWLTFLSLGLRMGEVLGLSWDLVDLDAGTVVIGQGLIVLDWEHGCPKDDDGAPSCGRKKGGWCPQRHSGGAAIDTPKTDAGERTIPLPGMLVDALRRHRAARAEWPVWTDMRGREFSLVFPNRGCLRREAVGQPMDQSLVNKRWKAFLAANGVPAVRPHDARHTAATTLMVMGVPDGVVMRMMGWSQRSMLTRYQHAPDQAMRDAMAKLQEFYAAAPKAPQPEPDVVSLADFRNKRRSS